MKAVHGLSAARYPMRILSHIYLTIIQLLKQVYALPAGFRSALKARRVRIELQEREAERLDRMCNPLKYRGK